MKQGAETVEVAIVVHRELVSSLLVSENGETDPHTGDIRGARTLPWSQLTLAPEQLRLFRRWQASPAHRRGTVGLVVGMPGWLARDRGLI